LSAKNVCDKIDNHIADLKVVANQTAKANAQNLNVFAFIGHGIINDMNEAIFLINDSNMEIKKLNVD